MEIRWDLLGRAIVLKQKYFRFSNFRLYPAEHLLLRDGGAVPLAPKVFDILLYLVQNDGHLVRREDLMQAVWPDSFVEDTNLTVNVSLLRKILGSGSDGKPYIETVPRKGYRFTPEVDECEEFETGEFRALADSARATEAVATTSAGSAANVAEALPRRDVQPGPEAITAPRNLVTPVVLSPAAPGVASIPAGIISPDQALPHVASAAAALALQLEEVKSRQAESKELPHRPTSPRFSWQTAMLLVLGLALLSGASYWWLHRARSSTVSASTNSIAILPFQPLNPAPQDEYLGMGLTDALITRMSNLQRIVVRPLGAVRKFATVQDPIAAGQQLEVQSVLEGSIQRAGERTRVTVRLLRVSDGELLWGGEFDEKLPDMFAVEDSISQKVASALALHLTEEEQRRLTKPYTASSEAYQLYMKGRYFWNKRTVDGVQKSIDYFQRAIAIDPGYARAYSGLADAYTLAGSYGYSIMPPREAMPKAEQAAREALSLDDSLAEAHTSLAYIKFTYDWDWAGAEQEFRRAIVLNPGYDTAHHWYSHELMALGRGDEALAEARRAVQLSPSDTVMNEHIGWTYMMMRDYDKAIQSARKALELDPNFLLAHRVLGLCLIYKGEFIEAEAQFQRGVEISHDDPVARAYLSRAYAAAGDPRKAEEILRDLERISAKQYIPPTEIAAIEAALGHTDAAFRSLDQAFRERASAIVYIKVDRAYEPLHTDPRFTQLLEQLHLN